MELERRILITGHSPGEYRRRGVLGRGPVDHSKLEADPDILYMDSTLRRARIQNRGDRIQEDTVLPDLIPQLLA